MLMIERAKLGPNSPRTVSSRIRECQIASTAIGFNQETVVRLVPNTMLRRLTLPSLFSSSKMARSQIPLEC